MRKTCFFIGVFFLFLGLFSKQIPNLDQSVIGLVFLGFIFLVDSICQVFKKQSLLVHWKSAIALYLFSMSFWTLFSVINIKWSLWSNLFVPKGALNFFFYWTYHGALFPAFFVTRFLIGKKENVKTTSVSFLWMLLALFCFILPFVHLVFYPLFFVAPFFFFDYLNAKEQRPSLLAQWKRGVYQTSLVVGISGLILGLLYEAINFYYGPFWGYRFLYGFGPDLFHMKLSGYIGYFVFGFDLYAAAIYFMSLLSNQKLRLA